MGKLEKFWLLSILSIAGVSYANVTLNHPATTNPTTGSLVLSITGTPSTLPPGVWTGGYSQPYSDNITSITLNFTRIDIHLAGVGNDTGWSTLVRNTPNIDLITFVRGSEANSTQLLGSISLSAGSYDTLKVFPGTISLTFVNNKTSTYTLSSGPSSSFTVSILTGLQLTTTATATVVLDLVFKDSEFFNTRSYKLTPVAGATVVA